MVVGKGGGGRRGGERKGAAGKGRREGDDVERGERGMTPKKILMCQLLMLMI